MFLKNLLGRRSVATVVAAVEKIDIAWTAAMAVNTIVLWGAGVLLRAEPAPAPANDTAIVVIAPQAIALPDEPARLPFAELAANDNRNLEAPEGGQDQ